MQLCAVNTKRLNGALPSNRSRKDGHIVWLEVET
jgi:hypothetical protein